MTEPVGADTLALEDLLHGLRSRVPQTVQLGTVGREALGANPS